MTYEEFMNLYEDSLRHDLIRTVPNNELSHRGVLGQKWGIRRYQNKDGSLTDEGRKHYGYTGVGSIRETFPTFSKWAVRAKEKSAESKQNRSEKKAMSDYEKKRHIIEYGSVDDIKKNMSKFSPSEMTEIRNRFATELQVYDQIDKLSKINKPVKELTKPKEKTPLTKKIGNGTKFVADNAGNLARSVTQANLFYNNVAKASNTLLGTSMRLIS